MVALCPLHAHEGMQETSIIERSWSTEGGSQEYSGKVKWAMCLMGNWMGNNGGKEEAARL